MRARLRSSKKKGAPIHVLQHLMGRCLPAPPSQMIRAGGTSSAAALGSEMGVSFAAQLVAGLGLVWVAQLTAALGGEFAAIIRNTLAGAPPTE